MGFERRDNSGALFGNDKQGNDKRPDAKGSAVVAGHLYDVAAWWRRDSRDTPYLSLAFSEPRPRQDTPPPVQVASPPPAMPSEQPATQPTLPAGDDPIGASIPF